MKHIVYNSVKWWMTLIDALAYIIVFVAYANCNSVIGVADINTDNSVNIVLSHPGESLGLFISGALSNIIVLWLAIVAVVSILYILLNEHEQSELIVTILNCILAIATVVLNTMFIKIYWSILLVFLVIAGIIYVVASSK